MSQPAEGAEPPAVLQPQNLEGGGDNHPLLFVIGRGNSLEGLQTLHGDLSTGSLVGDHTTHTSTNLRINIYSQYDFWRIPCH